MAGFDSLKKVAVPKAAEICRDIELDPQAIRCLESDPAPVEFLNALLERQLYPDAVRFLARALPKREATWWACICTRGMMGQGTPPASLNALEAAEQWVYKPTEANRRLADAAAQATSFDGPASWAAMAAFWSDGSMAPENASPVIPPENLASKAVAGAVMLAAVLSEPEKVPEKYRYFLEQGVDIANGGNGRPWQG
ncbi:hypothetical protein [Methylomicrobium sp. Wu6]|uniref:DUF6931 family protein n=1 Tax=Methylomicrobium sp. Wu6 TaxID=3107928 RepID=UPI002DD647F4|nr:hypothetical protein [Methylomicrobium sp. Wu6]MEC4750123.1 hypothetical protein [Methylomicrobium sp. Wu6]